MSKAIETCVIPPIPAAQYVRMSTDDQLNSIPIQEATIRQYAAEHGFQVVATYADEGKSGVELKTREALRQLLTDVVSDHAPFKAILVYDVSRWGRFQDLDEAAHYEFLCRSNGIPVCYCAEQFSNDESMPSAIMKALKRTMAAEYSRELSVKVLAGHIRLARLGFRTSGAAGLGLRRMMVSPDGKRELILQDGEQKAIKTYHSILVPGPKKEIDVIRKIFDLASHRSTPRVIARELNQNEVFPWPDEERRWNDNIVRNILQNEKYMGCSVYGKTTKKLGGAMRRRPPAEWIRVPDAFARTVQPELFEKVQKIIRSRDHLGKTDEYYLRALRRILARPGKIKEKLARGRSVCHYTWYAKRFGSMKRAYELVGYTPSSNASNSVENQSRARKLRTDLITQLKGLYPDNLRTVHLPGQKVRQVIEFDRHVRVAVHICRQVKGTIDGQARWILKAQPLEEGYPCLICLPDKGLTKLLSIYLVPDFGGLLRKYKILKNSPKWLKAGQKMSDLSQLRVAATTLAGEWQERDDTSVVGDVIVSGRTPNVTIGRHDISFTAINGELFKLLVLNAGRVVSRLELFHPFAETQFPSAHLNAHICDLRRKLGPLFRERVQTVKNEGYKYVMPVEFDRPRWKSFRGRTLTTRPSRL